MSQAFCVKCNRGKPKGHWESVELIDEEFKDIPTKRGVKKFLYGKCPKCGCKVTRICGK